MNTTATATSTLLTSSQAQTCIALGANYNYGKQGLPDLPTRLKGNNNNRIHDSSNSTKKLSSTPLVLASCASTTAAAASHAGSVSSKRKIPTGTTTSSALYKKDLLPTSSSSYRPYDNKNLLSSTLTESAALTTIITKGSLFMSSSPATLSRNSNESIAASNSTSSIDNGRRRNKKNASKENKKVAVIKKKSKSKRKHHLRSQTSVMEGSSAYSLKEPLNGEGLMNERRNYSAAADITTTADYDNVTYFADQDANDEAFQPNSTILFSSLSSIPPMDSIELGITANDDDNATSKQEDEDKKITSGMKNEKVRCAALPLLKQRLGYLWEEKMFTDVVFIVGRNRQKIEAHRMILASCSKVFENLLYGEGKPLQSSDEKYILYENDFSEPALEVFIKAMYTNEIPICLTLAMALEVFYATKKYGVKFLEDQVLEHIRQLLTVSNVFEALRFSTNTVELSYLAPICWRIVEERTAEVLEYHLESLEAHLFVRILERERLSLDEVQLFKYAVRWAANLCKKSGMKVTGKNKRHFMEPLLKHFRFTTITPTQFNEVIVPSRILETREILQIQSAFNKAADLKSIALPYKTIPRVSTAIPLSARDHNNSCIEVMATRSTSAYRLATPKNSYNGNDHNMDGSGDGRELQSICSDSVVVAPGLGSKVHFNGNGGSGSSSGRSGNKKNTSSSSTKLKNRRVPSSSSRSKAAR